MLDTLLPSPEAESDLANLTPRQIVAELDKYIIGQDAAKKSVAISLRNRWRRLHADEAIRDEITPANIILIGPTGVGKTEIARRLAKLTGAPFIKVEATKFTEVGYVGRDVESMIRDLMDQALNQTREEQAERVQAHARVHAEERLSTCSVPPTAPASSASRPRLPARPPPAISQRRGRRPPPPHREKLRERLHAGKLDEREVEVEVSANRTTNLQMFGPMGMEEMGINLQEMLGGIRASSARTRRVPVPEALELLTQEEAEKLVDGEAARDEAVRRVEQAGIVFIDEIDKVAGRQRPGAPARTCPARASSATCSPSSRARR